MFHEIYWLHIFSSAFMILVVVFIASFGLISYQMVKSYMNSKPVAKTIPSNVFLRHLSNTGQAMILLSSLTLILQDVFNVKNYLFDCFTVHASRFLSTVMMGFVFSISLLGCFEKFSPHTYLNLTPLVVNHLVGLIIVSAFTVCMYAKIGWCNSWDVCAVESQCDTPFRQLFYVSSCSLTMIILIGLVISKSCLRRSCLSVKSFICLSIQQVPPMAVVDHDLEMSNISANIHETAAVQPYFLTQKEKEMFVDPATHLMTFFIMAAKVILFVGICHSFGYCSEFLKSVFRVEISNAIPTVWILTRKTLRQFAVRKVKLRLQLV